MAYGWSASFIAHRLWNAVPQRLWLTAVLAQIRRFPSAGHSLRDKTLAKLGSKLPNTLAEMLPTNGLGQRPFSLMLCSRRQRCADVWAWREDWRACYAKSPTSRSHPKTQSMEPREDHRPETTAASARTTPMKDRIGDTRCVATTRLPRLRENAASAKSGKRMTGKSHVLPVHACCSERWFLERSAVRHSRGE